MELKNELKTNGYKLPDDINSTLKQTIEAGTPFEKMIEEGLCVTCTHINNCLWEENQKVYCEHYQ